MQIKLVIPPTKGGDYDKLSKNNILNPPKEVKISIIIYNTVLEQKKQALTRDVGSLVTELGI